MELCPVSCLVPLHRYLHTKCPERMSAQQHTATHCSPLQHTARWIPLYIYMYTYKYNTYFSAMARLFYICDMTHSQFHHQPPLCCGLFAMFPISVFKRTPSIVDIHCVFFSFFSFLSLGEKPWLSHVGSGDHMNIFGGGSHTRVAMCNPWTFWMHGIRWLCMLPQFCFDHWFRGTTRRIDMSTCKSQEKHVCVKRDT